MTKNKASNKRLKRRFYHWIVRKLMENIEEYRHGFLYKCPDGLTRWMVPVFSMGITDWPEGQAMCLIGAGATESYCNCRFCLHPTNMMSKTEDGAIYKRRTQVETMQLTRRYKGASLQARRAKEVLY